MGVASPREEAREGPPEVFSALGLPLGVPG